MDKMPLRITGPRKRFSLVPAIAVALFCYYVATLVGCATEGLEYEAKVKSGQKK